MKKIVFDFGGVLFRWRPEALLRREIAHIATDEASARHWVQEIFQGYRGDWGEFDRGTLEAGALVQRIARRTGLAAADVQRVVDSVPHELQPLPDSVRLLQDLHGAGRTLYFLSNMPEPYAAHLERENPFIACFEDGIFSSRVHHNKPERAIYELACAQFGAAASELVFLDDHPPNIDMARSLGWGAVHFRDAAQARAELRQMGEVW